jgi:flagellar capping protein FliD
MDLHIKDLENEGEEMMEFEPTYVQEFNLYLALKDLLTYSLCGIDLHSKGKRSENSVIIRSAIAALEKFLNNPNDDKLSMLVKVKEEMEGWSDSLRKDLQDFLKKVLSVLKDEIRIQENEYSEMYNNLMALLDKLTSMNKEVEERMLARYRYRKSYQI